MVMLNHTLTLLPSVLCSWLPLAGDHRLWLLPGRRQRWPEAAFHQLVRGSGWQRLSYGT